MEWQFLDGRIEDGQLFGIRQRPKAAREDAFFVVCVVWV